MTKDNELIWYASYGSNISEKRFHYYIIGGSPKGSNKTYLGCSDKTLPIFNEIISLHYELYFAKKSGTWNNGGVAFIKTNINDNVNTLGRMYLITKEQYIDVLKQENNHKENLFIDFDKTKNDGSLIFKKRLWYGRLIYLGEHNEHPIFTFTNENNLNKEINPPSKEYLATIISGLKETYGLNDAEIKEYFENKLGIKGYEIEKRLTEIIKKK